MQQRPSDLVWSQPKDLVTLFQMQHGPLLEGIQLKGEAVCQVGSQPMK